MKVENKFYQKDLDCLKVSTGEYSNYYYILRISKNQNSHLTFGRLLKVNGSKSLFSIYLPEIGKGHFLQMRQDTKDNNIIDLEIKIPNSKVIKPPNIHHQPPNNIGFYYREISYDKWKIEIAIVKGTGYEDLMKRFKEKQLKTLVSV